MTGNQDNSKGIVDFTLKEVIKQYLLPAAVPAVCAIVARLSGYSLKIQIVVCFLLFGFGLFLLFWIEWKLVISLLAVATIVLLSKISSL